MVFPSWISTFLLAFFSTQRSFFLLSNFRHNAHENEKKRKRNRARKKFQLQIELVSELLCQLLAKTDLFKKLKLMNPCCRMKVSWICVLLSCEQRSAIFLSNCNDERQQEKSKRHEQKQSVWTYICFLKAKEKEKKASAKINRTFHWWKTFPFSPQTHFFYCCCFAINWSPQSFLYF